MALLEKVVCGVLLLFAFSLAAIASTARAEPVPYAPPESVNTEPPGPAEPAECSTAPEDLPVPTKEEEEVEGYEPPDPVVAELRRLRIEQVETCEAELGRLDQLAHRVWWVVAESVAAGLQRAEVVEQGSAAAGARAQLLEGIEALEARSDCGDPCRVANVESEPVVVSDSEGTAKLVSAVDASGEASKAGLWFVAAVLLMGLLAYPLYKAFIFWREHV